MRARPAVLASIAIALAPIASHARSRGSIATGLERPRETVPARGVQIARAPVEGRVVIAGGSFLMGSTRSDVKDAIELCQREMRSAECAQEDAPTKKFVNEMQAHDVTVSSFAIDRTEVRVRDYARCVAVAECKPPGFLPGDPRFDRPEYPVVEVRWDDARDYCAWAGGRLPTEAEWEYAARGPARRTFPWGFAFNGHVANHGAYADDDTDASDGFARLAPVGSFTDGATPDGVLDLAGNAAEWVGDFYPELDDNGYGYAAQSQTNPTGPATGVFHVVRGGSYLTGGAWLRGAARGALALDRAADVGFRCAYAPR